MCVCALSDDEFDFSSESEDFFTGGVVKAPTPPPAKLMSPELKAELGLLSLSLSLCVCVCMCVCVYVCMCVCVPCVSQGCFYCREVSKKEFLFL